MEHTTTYSMRESKAKKKILQTADEMLKHVGYADLNVNEIAHEAGVSIGTLYYHFPEGKISILMEIRRRIADEYKVRLMERLHAERVGEAASFDEGLGWLLETLIGVHREERLVLAAMESEVLSNLAQYDELAASVDVQSLMGSDAEPVVGVLNSLLRTHPEEGLTLEGREGRVNKVMDVLIHRFVYVESMFGSEREFIDMMVGIVRALLA
jgi:AcrR family transcriptional regulator